MASPGKHLTKGYTMTLDEAMETIVTREEARREIAKHDGEGFDLFLQDMGDRQEYEGSEVLNWLGY